MGTCMSAGLMVVMVPMIVRIIYTELPYRMFIWSRRLRITFSSSIQFSTDAGWFDYFYTITRSALGVVVFLHWSRSVQMSHYTDNCHFLWVVKPDGVAWSYYDTIAQNPYGVADIVYLVVEESKMGYH